MQKNWKRMYMTSEHEKRRSLLAWRRKEDAMLKRISDLNETTEMLHAELRRSKWDLHSHKRAINQMRASMESHNLENIPVSMQMRLCEAADDEICPLTIEAVNGSPLPFEGCCLLLDPLKPTHKCAQLMCGHRFNAVWVMYHFVRNKTFRCPVCRKGRRFFAFDVGVVPECMVKAAGQRVPAQKA
jgi:hypothetical protein